MRGLTEASLKTLAGPRSYERGLGYLDAVSGVEVGDSWVTARVHGTERYEVELAWTDPAGCPASVTAPSAWRATSASTSSPSA